MSEKSEKQKLTSLSICHPLRGWKKERQETKIEPLLPFSPLDTKKKREKKIRKKSTNKWITESLYSHTHTHARAQVSRSLEGKRNDEWEWVVIGQWSIVTLSPSNSAPPPRLHTPSRRQSRPPISPSKKHKYEKTTKDLRDGVGPAREDIINRIFVFSPSTPSVCRRVHRLAESHFGTVFTHFTTHERRERGTRFL